MKEKLIELILKCDYANAKVISNKDMCPSCSIDEIAENLYIFLKGKGVSI